MDLLVFTGEAGYMHGFSASLRLCARILFYGLATGL